LAGIETSNFYNLFPDPTTPPAGGAGEQHLKDGGSTHVEEASGVLQDQLAGVRLVLAVIHVDVEFIGLGERGDGGLT